MPLVADFLKPVIPPERQYSPAASIVSWRELDDGKIVLEVFKRDSGSFGYRYQAWVAWRDAGNSVRSHGWHQIQPKTALITDNHAEAQRLATQSAAENGLSFNGGWKSAV